MPEQYIPPFTMTEEITNLVIEIGELVGQISAHDRLSANPKLRRENRIKTIYSSLAIEQNTLSLDQVTDVIDGKRVLAPPAEIREVKNAYEAYEQLQNLDMYSVRNLLKAHRFMTKGLVKETGVFRSKNAGVYDQNHNLIHAGSPAAYVPDLIGQLFAWLKTSQLHPLIKSCIFHYEFEFIHPFADGNGRVGRLWHTLILRNWKDFFAWLPVETMIHENQIDYYAAINDSNAAGESTVFVAFMLKMIRETLREIIAGQVSHSKLAVKTGMDGMVKAGIGSQKNAEINDGINIERNVGINVGINVGTNTGSNVGRNVSELPVEEKALVLLKDNPRMTMKQLAVLLGRSDRQVERLVAQLKKAGRLEHIGANKNGSWKVI